MSEDKLCLTIGGDHAIGIGTVHGFHEAFKDQDSCLIWIDAHADINTMADSESGNMHGMPVSFNLANVAENNNGGKGGLVASLLKGWFTPRLRPDRMAFIGLRSVDPLERQLIDHLKIPFYSMAEIDKLGIQEVKTKD